MRRVVLFIVCLLAIACRADDKVKRPDSYNYTRGVEACQNENYDEALQYLNKELGDNPKSGYAYSWIALIRTEKKEWGRALTAANQAIRFLPKKDKEYLVSAYNIRANVYLAMEDTVTALSDFATSIKILPDDCNALEKRAQIYFEQGKYDFSDADYRMIMALDQDSAMAYMGLGRNLKMRNRLDEAIE